MKIAENSGPYSLQERTDGADRALAETYGRGDRSDSRNRWSQALLALALCATVVGVFGTVFGSFVGIGLLAIGLPTLVATTVWCIRNWDY